jgi:hypothetical protein
VAASEAAVATARAATWDRTVDRLVAAYGEVIADAEVARSAQVTAV